VVVPLAPADALVPRLVSHLCSVFDVYGLDTRFIDAELAEIRQHRLAKTSNRSVIGTLNARSRHAELNISERECEVRRRSLRGTVRP
jgi:hypothetical protein